MTFDPGFDLRLREHSLAFDYGEGVFGPEPEYRSLDAIRPSLKDPRCDGPDPVYGIVMDVGEKADRADLERRMLLFGAVAYAAGRLGEEPVRSQGHVHHVSPHCGWSTPELFEIWDGKAVIYMQEFTMDEPGRCFAISAEQGDVVTVPPQWAHAVINADPNSRMVFGAWCDRQYGFVYDGVRAHGGLAYFPVLAEGVQINWVANPRYNRNHLHVRSARPYPDLGLSLGVPIYRQYKNDPQSVTWVSDPGRFSERWKHFEP
ncbi:MAG: glucose-6-phosphate isomerase family protein [Bryobacteraceae bacterium]